MVKGRSVLILLLSLLEGDAIVPPPTTTSSRNPPLALWVRGVLLALALALVAVFVTAWRLNPYREDGSALHMATHQQLGLPPCSFVDQTGIPCPACGMTTSFALLVRGDVRSSLGANWVGTLLATFCLLFIPWAMLGVVRGRTPFLQSLEKGLIVVVTSLLALMLLRWACVLGWLWYTGRLPW